MKQIYIKALEQVSFQHGYLEGLGRIHTLKSNWDKSRVFTKESIVWQSKAIKIAKKTGLNREEIKNVMYLNKRKGLNEVSSRYDGSK